MKRLLTSLLIGGLLAMNANAKSIVIYFSRADENYSVGVIEKGNTQVLAEIIAAETGSDTFHIERATPYSANYDQCIKEAKKEQQSKARPALKATLTQAQLDQYDTIYFGSPNWWGDLPMAVYTFIESLNWSGKTVYFFGTHEGSGANGLASDFKSAAKGCVMPGKVLSMYGHEAHKNDEKVKAAVKSWLAK